ncbi:hypothetical protein [uncultured Metabacillus sp.]|uniref:hypothetical protein n=1 Tax=Metabacillus sp. Hm71 TaxID=3450743 RepID=UPI002617FC45|nr:hypothetical protein [uncultured Metabacillus sp.]
MTRSILIAFIIPVFILSSCEGVLYSQTKPDEEMTREKQLLFFSDDENIDREAVYYDALLDIKKEFPEDFKNMKVISENSNYDDFEVDIYPSLLVIEEDKVIVHIEGALLTKEEIMKPISKALSTNK